jgi:DNA-binding response OmpR family regulator
MTVSMQGSVLVVDDDAAVARLAAAILEEEGHEVAVAQSADEALDTLRHRQVDVVITDVVLGARDGLDLAEELAALQPSVRVVFMSGYGAMRVSAGTDDPVLQKPFRAAELRARIAAALES